MSRSEAPRQLVHIGTGAIALSLRFLTWEQAIAMAVAAVVFNLWVLPRLTRRVFRPGDLDHPWTSGIVLYPLAVLVLMLIFPRRPDLAAAAWGILAAGDGMATLVGTAVRSRSLPWNPDKSLAGLAAFMLSASLASVGLLLWTTGGALATSLWWAVTASVVAALVETIPIRLDDNVSVPVSAALVLWSSTLIEPQVAAARVPALVGELWVAVKANGALAAIGLLLGTVTVPGALTGLAIGILVLLGGGWAAWGLLLATFIAASVCTRVGAGRKRAAGIAEARGGRRGPGNAIANTGLAAWACAVAIGLPDPSMAWLVCVAALATAGSDTVASEIGKAFGRTTWMVTSLRRVAPGTTGALSIEGTLAGIVAAVALAALAATWGLVPWMSVPMIAASATIASVIEGALGSTLEARGILNNDTLNFVNSALGAALTVTMWWCFA